MNAPNPDSLCNKIIKFPLLWKEAKKYKANYIATGHYIKKTTNKSQHALQIPKDKNKDQSYFLYDLTQKDLQHTLFPIGSANLTKKEVRAIAKKHKFSNHNKPGTKGICFVGKINMKTFLQKKIKSKIGKILSPEGKIIGTHKGIMYYTIGERVGPKIGLNINKEYRNKTGKKLYIADKIANKNVIIIAPQGDPLLLKKKFMIKKINWINNKPKLPLKKIKVRIRHLGKLMPATIKYKDKKHICTLQKPIQGIAAGQSAVIYKENKILGGGEIRFK